METWPILSEKRFFWFVGIKGTGMTALAELLVGMGFRVEGSDVPDTFYTDAILASLGIPVRQGFDPDQVPSDADVVVHSAAWDPARHPELIRARERGIEVVEYTRALGLLSATMDSSGVSGIHGKTTTTAMAGTLVKALGLPGSVLVGSGVSTFGGRQTLSQGDEFFIAETCEYRRHFLHFVPRRIILTSVEEDHLDYFKDLADIDDAFLAYGRKLPPGGALVYCADDPGARRVAGHLLAERPDIRPVPYGHQAPGPWAISPVDRGEGQQSFRLPVLESLGLGPVRLQVPGAHNVLNATAALALVSTLSEDRGQAWGPVQWRKALEGLGSFTGTRRRSEIIGETGGVLVVDDYGHHPRAVAMTLEGFRDFWPKRRLVVSFMSHTYSRTRALLDDFARSFGAADEVILHKIYASAREENPGGISGRDLYEATRKLHPRVSYHEEVLDALPYLRASLKPGDLLVTMGAGDNWRLGKAYLDATGEVRP